MLIMPSFQKSLIVEQFQGNYLNWNQNPKFTPLSETTSIPPLFIWESPPPPPGGHKYCFTDVFIGWPGRVRDARVLANSSLYGLD